MSQINESAELPVELKNFSPLSLSLPYVVEVVDNEETLQECVKLRAQAYGRHSPELGRLFSKPEPEDSDPHFTNMVARSKLNGQLLAAVRVEIRRKGRLSFESSFQLPASLRTGAVAEVSRLSVANRVGYSPRLMMIKAAYWWCRYHHVRRLFVTARAPTDRMYRKFEMYDLIPNQGMVPIHNIGNIPHRILWVDVFQLGRRWHESGNPVIDPIMLQSHSDVLEDIQARAIHRELSERLITKVAQGGELLSILVFSLSFKRRPDRSFFHLPCLH